MNDKIDFVILWVDGNDPDWINEKNKYVPIKKGYSTNENRFRDWGTLHFLFRGIEKYAPWVNHVYFITWGHLPGWLDINNEKISVIRHDEFIPREYRPTFNSNCIELNLHRIKGLSEHFVLLNDDTFFLNKVRPKDFFYEGKPRDIMCLNPILSTGERGRIAYTNLMNTGIINSHFEKKRVIKREWKKIFRLEYGSGMLRTLLLMPWSVFTGFVNPHISQPHLKSTFNHLWEIEFESLDVTCKNKFRGLNDCSHWLMRYWNLCSGNFVPRKSSFGIYYNLSDHNERIYNCIRKQRTKLICINDMDEGLEYEKIKQELITSFEHILPEKSSYEI